MALIKIESIALLAVLDILGTLRSTTATSTKTLSSEKKKNCCYVLTLSSELEIWSFHVVELQRTEKKMYMYKFLHHTSRAIVLLINSHYLVAFSLTS